MRLAFVTYGARSGATIAEKLRVYDAAGPAVTTVATGQAPAMEDGDQFTCAEHLARRRDGRDRADRQRRGLGLTVYGLDGAERLQANGLAWPAPVSWTPHGLGWRSAGGAVGSIGSDSLHVWTTGASRAARILTVAKLPVTAVAWTPKASQFAYAVSQAERPAEPLWIVNPTAPTGICCFPRAARRPGRSRASPSPDGPRRACRPGRGGRNDLAAGPAERTAL